MANACPTFPNAPSPGSFTPLQRPAGTTVRAATTNILPSPSIPSSSISTPDPIKEISDLVNRMKTMDEDTRAQASAYLSTLR